MTTAAMTNPQGRSRRCREVPSVALRQFTLLTLVALLWASMSMTYAASALSQSVDFNIPPQPVESALLEWSRQSKVQVMVRVEEVAGQQSTAVIGRFTAGVALTQLLERTDLTYEPVGSSTVSVKRVAATIRETTAFAEQPGPPAKSVSRGELEEVIVTAQKREERLQDVPISISVLGGNELDSSTAPGLSEALSRVPGVATTENVQGGGSQVTMRGVTASGPVFEGSSPIAYYLDSVPFGLIKSAIVPDANGYDMNRVEVLRGPQGTLYGASALNGVVRVLTNDANLRDYELKARTFGSSTTDGGDNYRVDVAANAPILQDKLAVRVVGGYEDLSGWLDKPDQRDANDAILRNARLKVNAQPTNELSIGLSAWFQRNDYGAPSTSGDGLTNANPLAEPMYSDYDAYGLKIGYEFRAFSLTSMTSYLRHENGGDLDLTLFFGTPMILFTGFETEIFSQEILFSSMKGSDWHWSAGAFYRDGEDRLIQTADYLPAPTDYADTSESVAVFGELGRRFMNGRLEWTLGLRYFRDDVSNKENVQSQGLPDVPLYEASDTFTSTTPRATLTWFPNDDVSVYASYSQGFRSGFPQNAKVVQQAPGFPPLEPDKLRNYEIGAKGTALQGRLSFDTSIYYIDWRDVQQTLRVDINGVPASAPVNGESASGFGVDTVLVVKPVQDLEFGVSLSWNDLTWNDARFFDGALLFDRGDRLNFSPEYTAGAFLDYRFPLSSGGLEGRLSASANYTSKQYLSDFSGGARTLEVGDNMLISRASISISSLERWSASIFADNLDNEQGTTVYSAYGVPDWSPRVRPRTIGLQLEYRLQ